jgi:hypothetical protein
MASGKLLQPSIEGAEPRNTRQKEVRNVAESNGIVTIASRSPLTSGYPA